MNLYCVVCKNGIMPHEAKELILSLPLDETLNNRFPSENPASNLYNLEVFKKGSMAECQKYLDNTPEKIKHLFLC
ncbi:hypothetical protein [Sulfurovum sp.]|jgi:hypothetical protein|uniref:hypothetical protein n=1 Tax=Sulfurovum sp. TaxID=1969726 RepID=UPI002A35BB65|nr:hypothetical protein [Sulfurovum sp.]MDY0402705.1 hypothetical protein [Sulfurovum sp.]